jgi:diguanylate cyclase (GGDEF)-like protein
MKNCRPFPALVRSVFVCFLFLFLALFAGCAYRSNQSTSLDSAESIHEAASNSRYGGLVRMQGVVTYYDPEWRLLFLQDSSGGLFVNLKDREIKDDPAGLAPGQLVEITGTVASSNIGIADPVFRMLGPAPLPQAQPWPDALARSGQPRLSQWVTVRGTIHSASFEDGRLTLTVVNGDARTRIRVQDRKRARPITLLGEKVEITGVSAVNDKTDPPGVQIFVSSLDNIHFENEQKLVSPFSSTPEQFSTVLASRKPGTFVHLTGIVKEQRPGGVLVLSDGSREIRVMPLDNLQAAPGDSAELLGFTSVSPDYQVEDATVRIVAPRAALRPLQGTLRTIRELKSLSVEDAAKQIPVDVRGTVTFVDPSSSLFFVQDATAGAYVDVHSMNVESHVGDVVHIQGVSAPGDYAPIITKPSITLLSHGNAPKPLEMSLQALASGNSDGLWVQIAGVVHSVNLQGRFGTFKLAIGDSTFTVQFPASADTSSLQDKLLDSEVRVNAVCGTMFNEKRQLVGLKFLAPSAASVEILDPAPPESQLKVRPIVTLLRFDPQNLSTHRVRIRGTVTLQDESQSFYLQDSSAAIYVMPEQAAQLRIGQMVEVSGFPVSDMEGPYLEDATITDLNRMAPIVPLDLSADALTSGLYDSQLVRVQGKLLEQIKGSRQDTLILRADPLDLRVRLHGNGDPVEIRRGSLLEVMGVLQAEGHRGQRAFRIAMRSPADIRIVKAASWWTPEHSARILALTVIAILAILLWVAFSAYRFRLHQSRHDPLTGLQNRGAALEYLERQLARAQREGTPIGVILADVDYFKRINDTLGHQTGDAVLEKISALLCADLRPYDVVGRYGGEEFLIVVPGCGPAMAKDIAERIRIRIMQEKFSHILPAQNLPVTCSFGIAVPDGDAWDIDAILDYADRALYTAKNSGRNAIVLASIPPTRISH